MKRRLPAINGQAALSALTRADGKGVRNLLAEWIVSRADLMTAFELYELRCH